MVIHGPVEEDLLLHRMDFQLCWVLSPSEVQLEATEAKLPLLSPEVEQGRTVLGDGGWVHGMGGGEG